MRHAGSHIFRIYALVFIVFINLHPIRAQVHTDTLDELLIIDSLQNTFHQKEKFSILEPYKTVNRKYIHLYQLLPVDQLLQAQTSTFIRNYGFNNLSTLSVRGTSSAQSQVLWNGIPVNSAATGYSDLSLLHTGLFDDVHIQYGGTSTLYGNGTIGGAVHLQSRNILSDYFGITLGAGSYQNYKGLIKAGIKKGQHQVQFKIAGVTGRNNFPYLDHDQSAHTLSNAGQEQLAATVDYNGALNLLSRSRPLQVQWNTWLQYDQRGIPPAIFESFSSKLQANRAWRNALSLKQDIRNRWSSYIQTGYQYEQYQYEDSLSFQFQRYRIYQFNAEWGLNTLRPFSWGNTEHQFLFFLPYQSQSLRSMDAATGHHIYRAGVAAAYQFKWQEDILAIQVNARKEIQKGLAIPFIYNFNISSSVLRYRSRQVTWKMPVFLSLQNSFRVPTLNELYYFPGGNQELRPESGENLELGFRQVISLQERHRLYFQSSYFRRNVHDWIYWLGSSIWTPYNIAEVYSRGWDFQLNFDIRASPFRILAYSDYAYTISTTVSSYLPGSNSIGRQIPYTPRYLVTNNLGIEWQRLFFNINHQYAGYRFTNLDESAFLPPYHLVSLQVRYYFPVYSSKIITAQFQVQNLFNAKYESVKGRPMPPTNWLLSISISI
ncbi:MAG: TonB-dependent receptor [Taibaiella sp.]|nr:TonB-dependent receptor [Taibaiella sp.]